MRGLIDDDLERLQGCQFDVKSESFLSFSLWLTTLIECRLLQYVFVSWKQAHEDQFKCNRFFILIIIFDCSLQCSGMILLKLPLCVFYWWKLVDSSTMYIRTYKYFKASLFRSFPSAPRIFIMLSWHRSFHLWFKASWL